MTNIKMILKPDKKVDGNDRNKNRFVNGFKKFFAIYAVLIAWQASLTSHYEKIVPEQIH